MNTTLQRYPAGTYVVASFPAWREAARAAIARGQSLRDFLAPLHVLNLNMAASAYGVEQAARKAK